MKNPAPNPVAILTHLLDLHRSRFASLPGLHSLIRIIHPVLFYDDASGTFQYEVAATGADFVANYVTAAAFIRVNGLQLLTKETTPAADDEVLAQMFLSAGPGPIVRLQCVFRRGAAPSGDFTSTFRLQPDNETHILDATIEAHWSAARLAYLKKTDGAWAMTELADSKIDPVQNSWHKLDFAINTLTEEWAYIKLDGKALAISPLAIEPAASIGRGRIMALTLGTTAVAAAQAETNIDQLLITTEEA